MLEKYETADLDKLVKELLLRQEPFNASLANALRTLNMSAAFLAPADINNRAAQAAAQPYANVFYGNGPANVLSAAEERERVRLRVERDSSVHGIYATPLALETARQAEMRYNVKLSPTVIATIRLPENGASGFALNSSPYCPAERDELYLAGHSFTIWV